MTACAKTVEPVVLTNRNRTSLFLLQNQGARTRAQR
jgi:hypothetical protein